MTQDQLQGLVLQGLSIAGIAKVQGCSRSTVRYWLRHYALKTHRGPHGKYPKDWVIERRCSCGETRPEKFYGHKRHICGACHNKYNLMRGHEIRKRMLEHFGARCAYCGFAAYSCALDIHHRDPAAKDPSFGTSRYWQWKRVWQEIQSCVLLCKNCHAALHAGEIHLGVAQSG